MRRRVSSYLIFVMTHMAKAELLRPPFVALACSSGPWLFGLHLPSDRSESAWDRCRRRLSVPRRVGQAPECRRVGSCQFRSSRRLGVVLMVRVLMRRRSSPMHKNISRAEAPQRTRRAAGKGNCRLKKGKEGVTLIFFFYCHSKITKLVWSNLIGHTT